jgi:hypothetical protein
MQVLPPLPHSLAAVPVWHVPVKSQQPVLHVEGEHLLEEQPESAPAAVTAAAIHRERKVMVTGGYTTRSGSTLSSRRGVG